MAATNGVLAARFIVDAVRGRKLRSRVVQRTQPGTERRGAAVAEPNYREDLARLIREALAEYDNPNDYVVSLVRNVAAKARELDKAKQQFLSDILNRNKQS